jgi:hypothetical protein
MEFKEGDILIHKVSSEKVVIQDIEEYINCVTLSTAVNMEYTIDYSKLKNVYKKEKKK